MPSFSINWPSLVSTARSPIILWRLWSHKPSHKHDSNKYQSKAFVICDHKSDETRSVTHENKAYLVWLMFRMLSNQHYLHRANQKLRSWANAVFQNRGVWGQAVPSFPSPFPVIHFFFALVPGADLGLILTDFLNEGPREQASRGAPGNFFWFLKSLKFPFSGFCLMPGNWKKKTFVQTIFQKVLLLLFYY